jgi:hypothetical protein
MLKDRNYSEYVTILEEICRFYILSFSNAIGVPEFVPHLNLKACENVLIALQTSYKKHGSPN